MNEALVVFAHGKGFVLEHRAGGVVREFIHDAGGGGDSGFDLEACGVDCDAARWEGQLVSGRLKLVDDGPGDYPGTRECCLQLMDCRPATAEEWEHYRRGEWPWPEESGGEAVDKVEAD
jgi:hypothetical protein